MKKLLASMAIAAASMGFGTAALAECGEIKMAEFNWASGELMANVDKIILEEGYGCDIELVIGGTTAIFASMNEKGSPEIAGEQWVNALRPVLDPALEEGRIIAVNEAPITGLGEGWWITPNTVEANPELKTVLDWIERPDLFPSAEDPSKGAFVGCPAGWGCQHNNISLFEAFDMAEKGWVLIDPGSAAGLDGSIAKASERGENWFGYYWSPTSIVGKYNLQPIPFGVPFAGADNWDNCIAVEGCPNPQPTAWVQSEVYTLVTAEFAEGNDDINEYLAARVYPGEVMGSMLVFMAEEQADGEDAAYEFLATYEEVWTQWVPADIAEKVKAAL